MNIDTYTIVYLITNLFNIAIIHKFMQTFFKERRTSLPICVIFYFSHFLITSLLYLFVDIPLLTLVMNWVIMFGISLNYKASIQKCLLSSFFTLAVLMITEVVVVAITGYFQFSFFAEGNYSNSLGVIVTRLVSYMVALIFANFKAIKSNQKVNKTVWIASVLIPITTIVLQIMILTPGERNQTEVIVSLTLALLLNVTAFYLYDSLASSYIQIAKTEVFEKEKEFYYNQCQIMQSSTEDLQAFRHDLKNQFIAVSELIDTGKYDIVKEHIDKLSDRINVRTIYSTTGNTPIDAIVNYKLQNAVNEQIKVNAEIAAPSDLEIDISDIITILGNLLDNAICAVKQLPENERCLSFKLMYSQDRLLIQVSNPYITEIQYENGEIISTKEDKKTHGFGLKNIEKAVEKYDGYMEINHENSIFTVDILMYLSADNKKR